MECTFDLYNMLCRQDLSDVSQYYNLHVVNNFTSMTNAGMHVNMIYKKTSGIKMAIDQNKWP